MTSPESELDRIRGYLQAQAQKPIDDLIARVQEGADDLHAAASTTPAGQFELRLEGEEWSPMDCLRHIVGSNLQVCEAIRSVAHTGALPSSRPGEPAGGRDDLLAAHEAALASLYEAVRSADPGAHLDIKWRHPAFGDLNWREWFIFLRIHCRDHARQIPALAGGA